MLAVASGEAQTMVIISPPTIVYPAILFDMSHTIRQKAKLSKRVARIRGQVEAIARALDEELECGEVLRRIASARGAMNSLMAEVAEDHIRDHAFRAARSGSDEARAAEDLVDIVRSYLK